MVEIGALLQATIVVRQQRHRFIGHSGRNIRAAFAADYRMNFRLLRQDRHYPPHVIRAQFAAEDLFIAVADPRAVLRHESDFTGNLREIALQLVILIAAGDHEADVALFQLGILAQKARFVITLGGIEKRSVHINSNQFYRHRFLLQIRHRSPASWTGKGNKINRGCAGSPAPTEVTPKSIYYSANNIVYPAGVQREAGPGTRYQIMDHRAYSACSLRLARSAASIASSAALFSSPH